MLKNIEPNASIIDHPLPAVMSHPALSPIGKFAYQRTRQMALGFSDAHPYTDKGTRTPI